MNYVEEHYQRGILCTDLSDPLPVLQIKSNISMKEKHRLDQDTDKLIKENLPRLCENLAMMFTQMTLKKRTIFFYDKV